MSTNFSSDGDIDIQSIIAYFRSLSDHQKALMSAVCKLLSLVLVMPATNAVVSVPLAVCVVLSRT